MELESIDIIMEAIHGRSAMGSRTGTHRYHHRSVDIISVQLQNTYGDIEEEILKSLPQARGNPVHVSTFTDAAHAGDHMYPRSKLYILQSISTA